MSDIKWTKEQKLAIKAIDADVLLTAAAGAGKTAVLAERCLYLLTKESEACDIDELLVLTYTEAAAAEMRRRIGSVLYRRSRCFPEDARLGRQLALLDKARISTVHSFCGAVLREYFYRLPVDPEFEILDADEADLLKLQMAEELFEDYYSRSNNRQGGHDFPGLVECYGADGGDRELLNLLIRMHGFLEHLRDRREWTRAWQEQTAVLQQNHPENLAVVREQKKLLCRQLESIIRRLEHARATIPYYPELGFYADYVEEKLLRPVREIREALESEDFAAAGEKLDELERFSAAPKRTPDLSDDDIQPIKGIIDRAKKDYKTIRQKLNVNGQDVGRQITATSGWVNMLIALHEEFHRRYQNIKQQQNLLDFADLEHLCLRLLSDERGGPSDIALQLRDRYRYLLIDEYQDISPVQEAIIQYISRGGLGKGASGYQRGNLFLVGDVKQSIYGFRQAEPDIFLEKFHRFRPIKPDAETAGEDLPGQVRIDLNKNFRSRREIIAGINYIFSRCMTEEFIGIDYDRQARLIYGADYPDECLPGGGGRSGEMPVELHLIERKASEADGADETTESNDTDEAENGDGFDNQELDATRREALIIGRRIRQMVGAEHRGEKAEFNIIDPQSGKSRPVQYRDIVVLLRSMKMHAELFSEIFHQMRIPVHAELTGGFFVATEIQDMLCLLKLLDNPQQDIPLASVLRSPLVGLSETQLTEIRLPQRNVPYYQAVFNYARSGPDTQLRQSLKGFGDRLEEWRSLARQSGLARLIWQIYRDTKLPVYVSSLSDGRQRYHNLIQLHDRARQFDRFAGKGLARFLRFIEKLRDEKGDFGPAPVLTEADNVVRIMSVHKSKGLEFPVVIAGGLGRKFNKSSLKPSILFDRAESCPIGLRIVDSVSRDRWPTVAHSIVADNLNRREMAEEMRILYVALTRAREKLLLTAGVNLAGAISQWQPWRYHSKTALPAFALSSAGSAIDWLGPALAAHPDLRSLLVEDDEQDSGPSATYARQDHFRLDVNIYAAAQIAEIVRAAHLRTQKQGVAKNIRDLLPGKIPVEFNEETQAIIDRLNWRYPHGILSGLAARSSVTELKRQIDLRQEGDFQPDGSITVTDGFFALKYAGRPFERRPRFLDDRLDTPQAAEIGTWTHLFLQRLDLERPLDEAGLVAQLEEMTQKGIFNDHQRRHIRLFQIARLFAHPLGRKMLTYRQELRREWSFTLAVPAAQIYPQAGLSGTDAHDPVLLRGIIDCFFETDGGVDIIDFKTDNIDKIQCSARARIYGTQMDYYRRAVESILKKPVRNLHLYFLSPGEAVSLERE